MTKWKYHIEDVCNKVSKSIGVMYKSRNILSKRLMNELYFSFIHSYLNYASIAWASTNKSNFISFHHHQQNEIRIIYDKDPFAYTKPLFKHAKALTVYEIDLFQILPLIFKCKSKTVFHNLYTLKPPSKYSLRTYNLLPKFGQFSLSFHGPYL